LVGPPGLEPGTNRL